MKRLSLKKIAVVLVFIIPLLVVLLQKKPLRADSNVQIIYKDPGITTPFKLGDTYAAAGTEMGTSTLKGYISESTSAVDILNRHIIGWGPDVLWADGYNMNPDSWHWDVLNTSLDAIAGAKKPVYNTNNELTGYVGPDKMITMGMAPPWMTTSTQKSYVPVNTEAGAERSRRGEGAFPAFQYYQQYWQMYSDAGAYPQYGTNFPYTQPYGLQSFYSTFTDSVAESSANGCQNSTLNPIRHDQINGNGSWLGQGYTTLEAIYKANPFRCSFIRGSSDLTSKLDSWHVADFVYMAKQVAQRKGGNYYQIWNEMKGYWDSTNNTYDYASFMGLYNGVYTAIKEVNPNAKVGGPYVTIGSWSDPNSASHPETTPACKGSWGVFDKRDTDAIRYWLRHKAGGDFINVSFTPDTDRDQGAAVTSPNIITQSNNSAYREFQIKEKIAALKGCIEAVKDEYVTETGDTTAKLLPVSIAELHMRSNSGGAATYPSAARVNAIYANTLGEVANNGFDYTLLWDVRYMPQLYNTLKGIRDNFGGDGFGQERTGVTLYKPTFDETKIGVFASTKKVMLVNKQNTAEPTSIDGCAPINLGAYEVKFVDLQDCNKPNTPPNFAAQVDNRNVKLTWGESTDVESLIAGYRVYRSGTTNPIASLGADARSYTDVYSGTTNTSFSYYVTSVDSFGNESDRAVQDNVNITTGTDALTDVSVTCTVFYATSNNCSIDLPQYCQNTLSTQPTHGTSVIANNKITYTSSNTSTTEENYVYTRVRDAETKNCNVNIKFVAAPIATDPLSDVSVSCTVALNSNTCSVTAPEYCLAELSTQPTHGTSVITDGKIVYTTSSATSRTEENYAHLRKKGDESKKCNVNIKFANSGTSGGGTGTGTGTTSGGSNSTNVKLPGNPKTGATDFKALKIIVPIAVIVSLGVGFAIYKKRSVSGVR